MVRRSLLWILAIQLFLVIFVPPVAFGNRSLFLSDLWVFLWVPWLFADVYRKASEAERRILVRDLVISAAVFLIVFIHGYFRVSLEGTLLREGSKEPGGFVARESDEFQFLREAVVAVRFLSWLWAAALVGFVFSREKRREFLRESRRFLYRALSSCLVAASLCMLAAKAIPELHEWFGKKYGFNPYAYPWNGRIYGIFRSPVEAGLALGFGIVLVWAFTLIRIRIDRLSIGRTITKLVPMLVVVGVALLGIMVTGTLTPALIILVVLAIILFAMIRNPRVKYVLPMGIIGVVGGTTWYLREHPFISLKVVDFFARFAPWGVYLREAFTRFDLVLFGFGFLSYHVDNSYIFFFNRGGLLLLGFMAWYLGRAVVRHWAEWGWVQRGIVIYLALTGLAMDTIVLRTVVVLLFGFAIPVLCLREQDSQSGS